MTRLADLAEILASDEFTQRKLTDDSGVILDVESLRVFTLNPTGMFLVEALRDGFVSPGALVDRLVDAFEVDRETAAADVESFVAELEKYLCANRAGG